MTKEEKLNLYKFKRAQVEADFNANGACSPDDARAVVMYFYDVMEAYGIDVNAFEKELNERHTRLYCVRKTPATGKEWIYIYFKDCFYLLVDDNMHELLIEKVQGVANDNG
jgi:hypothetical protein